MRTITHARVRTWRWIVWLLVPALPFHEFTHAIVANRWADVEIDWHDPVVTMRWTDAPPAAVIAAHIAPLLVGCLVGGLALLAVGLEAVPIPELHSLVWVWLVGNWFNYTALSARDLRVFTSDLVS